MRLLFIGIIVIVLALVGVAVGGALSSPDRLVIECTGPDEDHYFRGSGTYRVSAFFGNNAGEIVTSSVQEVDKPGFLGGLLPGFLGFAESHGEAFVRTTIVGPAGEIVDEFESGRTKFNFNTGDLTSGQSKPGSWSGPTVCFDTPGDALWTYTLVWSDVNGEKSLDTQFEEVSL